MLTLAAHPAEADPGGAFSKDAQNAAAEKQVAGMGTGGSIKVKTFHMIANSCFDALCNCNKSDYSLSVSKSYGHLMRSRFCRVQLRKHRRGSHADAALFLCAITHMSLSSKCV